MQVKSIVSNENQKVSFQAKPEVKADAKEIQNGKQKLALALDLLGVAGAAGVGIAMRVKRGTAMKCFLKNASGNLNKLSDIKFEKGIAKNGDDLFTGYIYDTLKSGKKVGLHFKDGKITESVIDNKSKMYRYENKYIKNIFGNNESITIKRGQDGKLISISIDSSMSKKTPLKEIQMEFEDGKLVGQKRWDWENDFSKGKFRGTVYDVNAGKPKILKEFDYNTITEYANDGTKKVITGNFDVLNSPISEIKIKEPERITWKDASGKTIKFYEKDSNKHCLYNADLTEFCGIHEEHGIFSFAFGDVETGLVSIENHSDIRNFRNYPKEVREKILRKISDFGKLLQEESLFSSKMADNDRKYLAFDMLISAMK